MRVLAFASSSPARLASSEAALLETEFHRRQTLDRLVAEQADTDFPTVNVLFDQRFLLVLDYDVKNGVLELLAVVDQP